MRKNSVTVPLYLRIPVDLRKRIEDAATNVTGYRRKGALRDIVVRALESAFPKTNKREVRS